MLACENSFLSTHKRLPIRIRAKLHKISCRIFGEAKRRGILSPNPKRPVQLETKKHVISRPNARPVCRGINLHRRERICSATALHKIQSPAPNSPVAVDGVTIEIAGGDALPILVAADEHRSKTTG